MDPIGEETDVGWTPILWPPSFHSFHIDRTILITAWNVGSSFPLWYEQWRLRGTQQLAQDWVPMGGGSPIPACGRKRVTSRRPCPARAIPLCSQSMRDQWHTCGGVLWELRIQARGGSRGRCPTGGVGSLPWSCGLQSGVHAPQCCTRRCTENISSF